MKSRLFLIALLAALVMLIVVAAPTAADDLIAVEEGSSISGESPPAGIDAVSWRYEFNSSLGTYTEILTGTVHGTPSNDDTSFPANDIGFTFTYDGVDYTQVSIQSNGFVAMGPTVSSSYTPLSTGSTNNVIAALGRDLQGNGTTSALWSATEGTAPNRVFIVQWKDYKRYGSSYVGDDFDFQIRLYETSNLVEIMYGNVTPLTGSAAATVQVGLRGASNTDFNNRMTDATHDWSDSLPGTANTSSMDLTDLIYPPSGLTYDWAVATGLFLVPDAQAGQVCKGGDVVYDLTLANLTGVSTAFDLGYTSVWPSTGPATSPVLASGETWDFQVSVHIPWSANAGDSDVLTVTATGGGETDSATATTTAGILAGWTDYANAPRPVRAPSIVYYDGKLYKIGGYDGAAQAYLDIYDIATDTWTPGADMPGARYWIDCEAIGDGIYCAGGYLSSGQTTLYRYDVPSNSWSTLTPMSAYRYSYASAVLNGKLYIIGGYGAGYTATLWEYDPVTDTWNYGLPSMVQGRRYHSAGVVGGKIYVAGGYSPSYLNSVEIYDPVANTWSPGPPMPTTWLNAADGVKHDRYLILAGGDDNSTAAASNLGWMLDTVTSTWSEIPPMPHALYSAEGDSDGTNFWIVSGRLYDGSYSYSPYTTLLDQCDAACTPVSSADFLWDPDPAVTGDPVAFHATAEGSPPIYFDWDFGDGGTDSGQDVVHTFTAAGDYLVQLSATNCDGASTATDSDTVTVQDPPTISITPMSLDVTHAGESVTEHELQVCNLGDLPLEWEVSEFTPTVRIATPAQPLVSAPAGPVERPVITSPDQCAQYENYAGLEPLGAAEFCGSPGLATMPSGGLLAPTDIGFAQDIGYISDNFVTFQLGDFTGQTVIGTNTAAYYGMDFDPAAEVLYALNDTTDELGIIDLATGAFTALVPCPPGGGAANWTGLSIDPVDGTFYGSTSTELYIIDPATGASTLVGAFGTGGLMIDIAVNMAGEMYGHDISSDSIYSIDPATGAATLIGLTGYLANYAQGMDFDNDDGTLYIFLYQGSGANVYGTVDLTTGAVTPLAVSAPTGEFEGATQTAGFIPDVPWLTEVPTNGVVLGDECATVTVIVDSNGLPFGQHLAGLEFESNDPVNPEVSVPVTLTLGFVHAVVEPEALAVELCPDTTDVLTLSICNTGTVPMDWTLMETEGPGKQAASTPFMPAGALQAGPVPDAPLTVSGPGGEAHLTTPMHPDAVLWDQPISTNTNAYANQDFESAFDGYDIFIADDFANTTDWTIDTIFVPGNTWNPGGDLTCANSFNWQIYPDNGGVPAGDPWTGGAYWNLSLAPTDAQVLLSAGVGGWLSDVTLNLASPLSLPSGTWWFVFYPQMDFATCFQYGRHVSDSTNGYDAHVINPGGGFGFPPVWTSIQDPVTWAMPQQDLAFRLEGQEFDIPWLSEDPTSGTVQGGECQDVAVTFDATGLVPDLYIGALFLQTTDPELPEMTIPVTMTVLEPASIVTVTHTVNDLEVTFDATVSGTEPIEYAWDFGDGNTSDLEDPVYTYVEGGCYTVTLTVVNGCGEDTWTEQICVCDPVSILDITWLPAIPVVDEEILFTASAMGTEPIAFAWQFGDGGTGTGITATHVYAEPGDYVVTVMATNCDGAATDVMTDTVTVQPDKMYYYLPIVIRNYD